MSTTAHSSAPPANLNIGAINPYALAEVRLGKKINWSRVVDSRKLLEQAFGKPYAQLFDPKFGSPVYAGLKLSPDNKAISRDESHPVFKATSGHESLTALFNTMPAAGAHVAAGAAVSTASKGSSGAAAAQPAIKAAFPLSLLNTVSPFNWADPGHFFEDAAQPFDVIQGALGDCYFVAALASVAWAHPFVIAQRTRNTDAGGAFATPGAVDMLLFSDGTNWKEVEVTELLPLQPPGNNYVYARSDRADEIWPAVYEKAYVRWRTNSGDRPNYAPIAGGDPVLAAAQITGLAKTYCATAPLTPHDIWQDIRSNCLSYKTFNPMVAWTYPTSDPSVGRNYASANIVANHAYSVLGWHYNGGQEYIVLRNPWGSTEATLDIESGTWVAFDGSFWHSVPLSSKGVFALRSDIFKLYYAAYGWVSGSASIPEF